MKMTLNDQQYERIARWLDGERVSLSEPELRAAEQIKSGEGRLGVYLDVRVPGPAIDRARSEVSAALAARGRSRRIFTYIAPAAAAAMLLIGLGVLFVMLQSPVPVEPDGRAVAAVDEAGLLAALVDPDAGLLEADLEQIADDLFMASVGMYDDAQLEQLDQELAEVWLDPYVLEIHDPLF